MPIIKTKKRIDKEFRENFDVIDQILEKNRRKWSLKAINWMDYDDVKQIIKIHIYKKWHLWDKKKGPIEPWINTVVSNQIRNLLRNNYQNYARPCLNCPHNLGGDGCAITISSVQDSSCPLYFTWTKKKKDGFNIKLPLPLEHHSHELIQQGTRNFDIDKISLKIQNSLEKELSPRLFTAYMMMFIENCTDEEVADFMGYRSSEKNRKAGYKQMKNLKEMFRKKIIEILEKQDII